MDGDQILETALGDGSEIGNLGSWSYCNEAASRAGLGASGSRCQPVCGGRACWRSEGGVGVVSVDQFCSKDLK